MNARVKYITLTNYDRVIVVSDMHGHHDVFCEALKKSGFCGKDARLSLVISATRATSPCCFCAVWWSWQGRKMSMF